MLMWAPRKWTMAWGALCGAGFAKILFSLPFRLAPLLGFVWLLGQYGLVMLSRWDPQWDDVLLASWTRRKYKRRYESG
jgi:type IV secretory pathway TrbD component